MFSWASSVLIGMANKVNVLGAGGGDGNAREFISTWMCIIGIYPLNSLIHKIIAIIFRYGLWLLNLLASIAQIVLFYELDYDEKSATEYWNTVIDYWNWSVHNISVHSWIVLFALRKNKWIKFHKKCIKINHQMQIKYLNIAGVFYIIFFVKINVKELNWFST